MITPSNTVELPVPPSTNAIWRVARTRSGNASVTLARRYRDWLDEAIILLRLGMAKVKAYPVAVRIVVCRGEGWHEGRDLDNVLKPVIDAIRKAGRIVDDNGRYVTEVQYQGSARSRERRQSLCPSNQQGSRNAEPSALCELLALPRRGGETELLSLMQGTHPLAGSDSCRRWAATAGC